IFVGLPSPAAGLFIASFPLILLYNKLGIQQFLVNKWVLYVITLGISYLMISSIKMFSLKFSNFTWKDNWKSYSLLLVGLICAFLFSWLAIPIIIVLYILLSLLSQKSLL
ncbi:MAG: CDP-alcohol phosphatidyltransferase, partial [Chitinophagaceae bacterium]